MSTPTTSRPRAGQGVGVAAGPAADVEHPHPRPQVKHVDQEGHLLLGAPGERVAQSRPPGVAGEGLELPGR